MSITVDRSFSNRLIFGTLLVAWTALSAALTGIFGHELTKAPSPFGWGRLLLGVAFFAGVLFYLVDYYVCRLVFRAEFGDECRFRTLLGDAPRRLGGSGTFRPQGVGHSHPGPLYVESGAHRWAAAGSVGEPATGRGHFRVGTAATVGCRLARLAAVARNSLALTGLGLLTLLFALWLGYFVVEQLVGPGPVDPGSGGASEPCGRRYLRTRPRRGDVRQLSPDPLTPRDPCRSGANQGGRTPQLPRDGESPVRHLRLTVRSGEGRPAHGPPTDTLWLLASGNRAGPLLWSGAGLADALALGVGVGAGRRGVGLRLRAGALPRCLESRLGVRGDGGRLVVATFCG